jgi:hypothetical protein
VRQKGARTTVWVRKHARGSYYPQARGTISRPLSGRSNCKVTSCATLRLLTVRAVALKYCDLQVAHLARLSESVATRRPAYLNFRGLGSHAGTNKLKSYCTAQAVLELLDLIPAGWVCHGCSNA